MAANSRANSRPGGSGGGKSTGTAVKEQGSQVAQSTSQTSRKVAHSAAEQGKQVVQETGRQAHHVVDQAQTQLVEQASAQQKRAAGGLRSLGEQLRSAVDKSEQSGPAVDLIRQASDRVARVADWLEQREPGQVVDEMREFARRRPGAFLGSAAAAGLLLGRLTRGMSSGGASGQPQPGTQAGQPATAAPQPVTQAPQRGAQAGQASTGSGPVVAGSPSPILSDTPSPNPEMSR